MTPGSQSGKPHIGMSLRLAEQTSKPSTMIVWHLRSTIHATVIRYSADDMRGLHDTLTSSTIEMVKKPQPRQRNREGIDGSIEFKLWP